MLAPRFDRRGPAGQEEVGVFWEALWWVCLGVVVATEVLDALYYTTAPARAPERGEEG